MDIKLATRKIKHKAIELGFDFCGISHAEKLYDRELFLERWLGNGFHASMHYMEKNLEKRTDPEKLFTGAKSVISVLLNYYPVKVQPDNVPQISKYALGCDYHFVIKEKLKLLLDYINLELIQCKARIFTDSAPVLERAWAAKAGLGWIGKNTNLIVPKKGSYFFIGELITDVELDYGVPIRDFCGTCTKCINACPTNALIAPYTIDSNKCISYLTIENKNPIPNEFKGKITHQVFGCDICQDVCPWNKYSKPTKEKLFAPKQKFLDLTPEDWMTMNNEQFNEIFENSPVLRAGFNGLKRNIGFIG